MRLRLSFTLALALLLPGCSGSGGDEKDAAAPDQKVADTQPAGPDIRPAGVYRVAAVQYSSGTYTDAQFNGECKDDVCALTRLMERAAAQGAQLVVTPEYATDQTESEAGPKVGDNPVSDDARWPAGSILKAYAKAADRLDLTAVVNLITEDAAGKLYNTNVAIGPDGKVLARHYKFQLFGGEGSQLTPGHDVTSSFFDTPVGKAGLMICADAQCLVTNLKTSPDCAQESVGLIQSFYAQHPALVAFSAYWTVGGTSIWAALNVQQKVAKDMNVWLVGANNISGQGRGGGIWKPGGEVLETYQQAAPHVVIGDIPLK